MDLNHIITLLINFTQHWIGTTVPRIIFAFIGTLMCVLAVAATWERRIKVIGGALFFIVGTVLILFAMDPSLPYVFAKTSYLARIRVLMIFLSFVVVVITIEAIRRSHLQERYALLWVATGLIILSVAFFPNILDFFTLTVGTSYLTSVVGIIFIFLLLIAFHFSLALSGYQKNQTRIAQRCAILEERIEELEKRLAPQLPEYRPVVKLDMIGGEAYGAIVPNDHRVINLRRIRGSQIVAPLIILVAVLAVLGVGLLNSQPMIGDEVTHYYMLKKQAENLSKPNFLAEIPTGWGTVEVRDYPHTFLWHYLGAIVFRLSKGSFAAIQLYQAIFWAQFLFVAYLLAKSRGGIQSRAIIPYLLVLASLPLSLIFAVTFYQDIPASAQILTAFYLLNKHRNIPATLFVCIAIGFKITALLFLPAFFGLMIFRQRHAVSAMRVTFTVLCSILAVAVFTWGMGEAIKTYAHAGFYPQQKLYQLIDTFRHAGEKAKSGEEASKPSAKIKRATAILETQANRPGNLKLPENYLIYGGVVLWLTLLLWLGAFIFKEGKAASEKPPPPSQWLWITGLSYILMTAYFLRAAPDARFFLPGLAFILLPMAEKLVRLPKAKLIIALLTTMAILQGGYVLAKTAQLRRISPSMQAAIRFLAQHPPVPQKVFMYPEGNYRLFPVPHEWYFNYHLKEFWHAGNNKRIELLRRFRVGAIVIKKNLIGKVGRNIVNLGIYPEYFVKEIASDHRFTKIFENRSVAIFLVPGAKEGVGRKRDTGQ